jgi:hypothetical protein
MQELAMQVPGIQDDELLDRFTRGLKPRTPMEVVMREPQSFDEAVKLADRYDSLFTPGFSFSRQPSGSSTQGVPPVSFPSAAAANPILPTSTPMEIDALRRKPAPLTQNERSRLMKTGGCFYCRILANCPSKPAQRPRVNNVETVAPIEETEPIYREGEPRSSENFMPQ